MSPLARALVSLAVIASSVGATMLAARLQPPPPPPPSRVASVFSFGPDAVSAIDASTWQGAMRAVRRDGSWSVEALELDESVAPNGSEAHPSPSRVDEEVAALVRNVVALPEVNRFPLEGSLAEFGLDDPRATVVLTLTSGQKVTLEIGDRTMTGAGLYARIVPSDEVLQIGGLILNEIGGAFFQLRGWAGSAS